MRLITICLLTILSSLVPLLQSREKQNPCTGKNWYLDQDNDGFGDARKTRRECDKPQGYVADSTDCNDQNSTIFPGAPEIDNDGIDQNCDGFDSRIWYRDNDGDGFGDPSNNRRDGTKPNGYVTDSTDCNDDAAGINPGAAEIPGNGVDEDCDGSDAKTWFLDADKDSYGSNTGSVVSNSRPDNRYVLVGGDCDDNDATVFPGATEVCDNKDNDCDAQTDEGFNKNSDIQHCGSCGNACPPGWKCVAGICVP